MLSVHGEGYWATHADFGHPLDGERRGNSASPASPAALVGGSRAADMAVNILLPLVIAHADRNGLPRLRETALEVYARYPKLAENSITRAMSEEALGPRKGKTINGARRQQGLMPQFFIPRARLARRATSKRSRQCANIRTSFASSDTSIYRAKID